MDINSDEKCELKNQQYQLFMVFRKNNR